MADAGPGGGSGEIVWPPRLKRTPVRVLWFDRIRTLPAGLDLQAIADRFGVGKTTAHMWVNTFGYVTRDGRGGPGKKRQADANSNPVEEEPQPVARADISEAPGSVDRIGSFDAISEDGSRHVIFVYQPPPGTPDQGTGQPPLLFTSFNERVYRVSKGVYKFVATGKRLISKDGQAP